MSAAKSSESRGEPLRGTAPLEMQGDLAQQMVAGFGRYLENATQVTAGRRSRHWKRDYTSSENYTKSIEKNRHRFRKMIGLVDERVTVDLKGVMDVDRDGDPSICVGEAEMFRVFAVRWSVLESVEGEGLLLLPRGRRRKADVVALPDCDWSPEMLVGLSTGLSEKAQYARRLAENGCRVLVVQLIYRDNLHSGIPEYGMTNQTHREFIYRSAFALGRHVIGYEVQRILAAVDWLTSTGRQNRRVGIIGYGEGGLLALYSAAADQRIDATAVCGYFRKREQLWREPIYRNVFGLLDEFGDAELASLVAPRALTVENCRHPRVDRPPDRPGRQGGAPGIVSTPPPEEVREEFARARKLVSALDPSPHLTLVECPSSLPGSDPLLRDFMDSLVGSNRLRSPDSKPAALSRIVDPEERQHRQFDQLVEQTQLALASAESHRRAFWTEYADPQQGRHEVASRDAYLMRKGPTGDHRNLSAWKRKSVKYRRYLWDEIIGRLPTSRMALNPRTRQVFDEPEYRGYEVVLDVYRDVFAYGILLVPKKMRPRERRPVVVCQHGLEGRSKDVADPGHLNPDYNQYACHLAERGFITFSPQNPYIGEDLFRQIQRRAHPLKKTLFSFVLSQNERILDWLQSLPFVDRKRIGFYGLSYGGFTAMRIPALLERYCLSICSANYGDWTRKVSTLREPYGYGLTTEYEMPEFDLGNTFNHAEMSWLICPRPFMVERGHHDQVTPDEWVGYEYAKTQRHYALLGLADKTEIEYFDGGHRINAEGTFEFLSKHLNWPRR